jgi:MEMO1 family protein
VTLTLAGHLRGCIGSLKAHRPLVADVAENAIKAGHADPRFAAVTVEELDSLQMKIAVLGPPAPMRFSSEADLLGQLRPGEDGLILSDRGRRGTFLPMVWESLPEPGDFWRHLKRKAGLAPDHLSATLEVHRYQAESFAEG